MVEPQKLNEENCFNAFQAGKQKAFRNLLQSNYRSWVNYARDLIQSKLHSEELVLETFSKLWDRKGYFISFENVDAFVKLTVDRACRDYLVRIISNEKRAVIHIPGKKAKTNSPHRYKSKKNRRWLTTNEEWLPFLTIYERQIFLLYYFVEVDYTKISNLTGTNIDRTRYVIKRANKKLLEFRKKRKD